MAASQQQRHMGALRRLRSLGDLRGGGGGSSVSGVSQQQQQQQQQQPPRDGRSAKADASATTTEAVFDRDEMLRQRLLWEARARRKAAEAAEAAGTVATRGGATEA